MTLRGRLMTLGTSIVIAAGLGVATAPEASAAPCEYFADLPATIAIRQPEVRIAVPLHGCEGNADYADTSVYGPHGMSDFLLYDGSRTDYWYLDDWEGVGTYDTSDGEGATLDGSTATWRGDTTVVKVGTWAGVSAVRSGSSVTVTARATRYDTGSDRFIPFAYRVVAVQQCLTATTGCSVAAYLKTDGAGYARVALNAPATRYYRVVYGASASFWGATSASRAA